MKERWIEYGKKEDFKSWGEALSVSPLIARILKNRGIDTIEEAREFLYGGTENLLNPEDLKELPEGTRLVADAIRNGEKIAIVNDYDCDGIFAGQILFEAIAECGGTAFILTPDRMKDGYGINRRLIDEAKARGAKLLLTCDNGISAIDEVRYAKTLGLKVVVTDHHELKYEENAFDRTTILPEADAVVDAKRPDETYGFRDLAGAGVAFKLATLLYRMLGIPGERVERFYEYAAIATIADVVPLKGENRILAKEGLKRLRKTENVPLRALMEAADLDPERVNAGTVGFVLAPSINAIGRVGDIELAARFLRTKDPAEARALATEIRALNDDRKEYTEKGVLRASEELKDVTDKVLVVYLPGVHESVAGIIAGRLRETFSRPAFVATDAEEAGVLKGSGRSIPAYSMSEALHGVQDLLLRFGGHAQAAGFSLKTENLEAFRRAINEKTVLTEEDLMPTVFVDARVPFEYLTEKLVGELSLLEPFGTDNDRPLLAVAHATLRRIRLRGANRNVMILDLMDEYGSRLEGKIFGDYSKVTDAILDGYGEEMLEKTLLEETVNLDLAFTFQPEINEFMGRKSIQLVIRNCCKIPRKSV